MTDIMEGIKILVEEDDGIEGAEDTLVYTFSEYPWRHCAQFDEEEYTIAGHVRELCKNKRISHQKIESVQIVRNSHISRVPQ